VAKRRSLVSLHRQSIRPSTRFKRLPVWVSKADIVAYLRLSPTDAQAIFDSADRRCLIDGIEKISKYALQVAPLPDLIRVMQRHPSRPSIRRLFRAAIEKILSDRWAMSTRLLPCVYGALRPARSCSELELWRHGLLS
jgi:hypothetical protein